LNEEGVTEQQHRERQRPQAEQQLKGGIILGEIADKEGLSVSENEIDERIKLLKGQYQDEAMQAELDKPAARRDIEGRLLTEKTIAKLTSFNA
jgi:FKBP-type peptidyl-prolyl cis-trans isomerase (trigger factor)